MNDDESLKKRISEVQEKYGHLLTKEAALSLLKIAPPSITAKISRIFKPYHFEKAGRRGKVCRVEIELMPQRERKTLVLWDADVDKLGSELKEGLAISLTGTYEKEGELHVGRNGSVRPASESEKQSAKEAAIIRELRAEGDAIHAVLEKNGKAVKETARGARALELLGLKVRHESISFYTVLQLKREKLIGKAVNAE